MSIRIVGFDRPLPATVREAIVEDVDRGMPHPLHDPDACLLWAQAQGPEPRAAIRAHVLRYVASSERERLLNVLDNLR